MRAPAAPHERFEPEPLVVTVPNCLTIVATALVVEVFPLVPDIRMIFLFRARSEIASGSSARRMRPGSVSPLLPMSLDANPALFATAIANASLGFATC